MLEGEEKIIKQAGLGKPEYFNQLYEHYLPNIYRFIYMKVTNKQEAEDITNEVFLTAWQNIKKYEFQGFPFSSWLYRIARNRVIDFYRLRKNHVSLEEMPIEAEFIKAQNSIEFEMDQNLNLGKVKTAIKTLKPDQQDVLLMRFMEDLSHDEIAEILDKSAGAIRLIQHRAINQLKKILES